MLVTTGGTTKRIDRLERQGLVTRRPSDVDGRGRVVALTPSGRRLTDDLIAVHLANEERILAPLSSTQRGQLAALLGVLAAAVEGADQVRV
jgi:DNA-binding MarR family transcriptional regulator